MTPLGPNEDRYRASLRRLVACRWLRPDAELEALAPAALSWLDERADELRAALCRVVAAPDALSTPTVALEHSAEATFARWTAAWRARNVSASPVIGALDLAAKRATMRLDALVGAEAVLAIEGSLRAELAVTFEAPSPWAEELARHEREAPGAVRPINAGDRHPAVLVAEQHLRWVLAFGGDDATPSPWAPILAIFERGAWPAVLPDATLLVYVPVLRGDRLVPSPERASDERGFPVRTPRPARFATSFPALSQLGVSTPPSLPAFESTRMLGRIAVVTPTPRDRPPPRRRPRGAR